MKNLVFFVLLVCLSVEGLSLSFQPARIQVGLFWNNKPESVILTVREGKYEIFGDGKKIIDLENNVMVQISAQDDKLYLKTLSQPLGSFTKVDVRESHTHSAVNIKANKTQKRPIAFTKTIFTWPIRTENWESLTVLVWTTI